MSRKAEVIQQLKKFYKVSESVLSPDNCTIRIKGPVVTVRVDGMGNEVWRDKFEVRGDKLVLVKMARPQGSETEWLFLPEVI